MRNNTETKKEELAKIPANVQIDNFVFFEIECKETFIRLTFQSVGGGVEVGQKIFVFDHRAESLARAKSLSGDSKDYNLDQRQRETLLNSLNKPAMVTIVRKTNGDKESTFMNLFDLPKEKVSGLLSVTQYTGKHNAGYSVQKDNSIFSLRSDSSSRTGRHEEMLLLALTNKENKLAVYKDGYANVGHDGPHIVLLGNSIEEMAEEEYDLIEN